MADIKLDRLADEEGEEEAEGLPISLEPVQFIMDELSAVCNSLGKLDENDGTYMKDRDCKPCLREIQRYLNADGKHHTARCTLGAYNIIKTDLIPLMVQYCDYNDGDPELFNTIVRLSSNLTSSIVLLFDNKHEIEDKLGLKKLEMKLLNSLYNYKVAFAESDQIWSTLNTHLRHNRDDDLIFERIIILIRNILHIPVDSTADMGVHAEFDAHDMCLYRMDKSGLLETIIELTSDSQKGPEFCFHLTEIIYLMLRDQNPETLAKTRPSLFKRKLDDHDVDKRRLAELSARERRMRQDRTRNSNQLRLRGSSFIVQNIRAIGDKNLVLNKPLVSNREEINFDRGKTQIRLAKNKKPLSSETSMQISDTNTKASRNSYSLRVFCQEFLKKIYNNYMHQIKHNLIQRKSQENDETYYLWAIQFFTAFCRHSKMSIDFISETLSTSTLHYIQVLITSYQEKIKLEKKEFLDTSKRLHLAIRAYREILILIRENSQNENFADKISTIKKNVFTENDYTNLLLTLFQQYSEPKHSSHYLEDLIQTNHIFLEVLDTYSSEDTLKSSFLYKYCCPDVIKCHANCLKNYKINQELTNTAILKLFEKIVATGNEVVLFQASLFKTLLNVLDYGEGFKLLTVKLIRKFGKMANKKRWMYQELLFWKTANDVIEIENAIDPPPAPLLPDPETNGPPNEDMLSSSLFVADENVPVSSSQLAANSQNGNEQQVHDSLDELRAELWDSDEDGDQSMARDEKGSAGEKDPARELDLEGELDLEVEQQATLSGPGLESDSDSDGDIRVPAQKRKAAMLESDSEDELVDPIRAQQLEPAASPEPKSASGPPSSSASSSPLSELPDGDDLEELKDLLESQPDL